MTWTEYVAQHLSPAFIADFGEFIGEGSPIDKLEWLNRSDEEKIRLAERIYRLEVSLSLWEEGGAGRRHSSSVLRIGAGV